MQSFWNRQLSHFGGVYREVFGSRLFENYITTRKTIALVAEQPPDVHQSRLLKSWLGL